MSRQLDLHLRAVALVLFLVAVILYGWNSDDAYHSYIMAKHLAEGKGFVYNTGFRTTASTHPLLTLLEAFVFLFTDNPDVCGLLLGLLFSGLAAYVLLFHFCPSCATAWCMLGLMVSSHCFMSFTTSGLENSILFFLGADFLHIYLRHPLLSKRNLFEIAILMAFLAMARSDSVLIFIPMAVWAYLVRTKVRFPVRVAIGAAGLLPFVLWTGFSVLYYGFPFPNTYYAKLHTGIPLSEYITHGLWYHVSSWSLDPMLLLVPALFIVLAILAKERSLIPLILGLIVYCLYIVSIGGDFMAGRHLTQQYFLSLCGLSILVARVGGRAHQTDKPENDTFVSGRFFYCALVALIGIGLCWNWFVASIVSARFLNIKTAYTTKRSAVDERACYLEDEPRCASLKAIASARRGESPRENLCLGMKPALLTVRRAGVVGVCFTDALMSGTLVWECRTLNLFLTDDIALPDPLLSHLKVDTSHHWRIGHAQRELPKGYQQSVGTGQNRIENPSLREYYDKLLLVMTGDLFSRERLKTILDLNRGRYDHLLSEYESDKKAQTAQTKDASSALSEIQKAICGERNADKAIALLNQAADIDDSPVFASLLQYYRGCVFEDLLGDDKAAESEYEQALSNDWTIDLVPCANRLARLKAIRGETNEAIQMWEKAIRLGGITQDILWNLSLAYRESDAKGQSNNGMR